MATELKKIAVSCSCCEVSCPTPRSESQSAKICWRFIGFKKDGKLYRETTLKVSKNGAEYMNQDLARAEGEWKVAYTDNDEFGYVKSNYESVNPKAAFKFSKEYEAKCDQVINYIKGSEIPKPADNTINPTLD